MPQWRNSSSDADIQVIWGELCLQNSGMALMPCRGTLRKKAGNKQFMAKPRASVVTCKEALLSSRGRTNSDAAG